jgi:hypothetical protein
MKKRFNTAGMTGRCVSSNDQPTLFVKSHPKPERFLRAAAGLLAAAFLLTGRPAFAGYGSSVKQGDPLLYYHFNHTSGNLVNSANEAGAITLTAAPQSSAILGSGTAGPRAADGRPAFENDNLAAVFSGSGTTSKVLLMGTGGNAGALLTALNGSAGVTVQMWIKPASLPTGSNTAGLFFTPQFNGGNGIALQLTATGVNMLGRSQGGEANLSSASWTYAFTTNTWYKIVAIWNYAAKTMSLYINGTQVGSAISAPNWLSTTYNHTNPNSYHSWLGATASPVAYFVGAIDDFALYDRALSSAEIGEQYALSAQLDPWPFDRPSLSTLRASPKKVFAHYFTPYPTGKDNEHWLQPDYYQRGWMSPYGVGGTYQNVGGMLRERPLPVPVVTSDPTHYERINMEEEVRKARELGLDGFTMDVLSGTSHNFDLCQDLMDAANNVDTGFKIVIMPDLNTAAFGPPTSVATAGANMKAAVRTLSQKPAAFRPVIGGTARLVLAPYDAQKRNPSDWQTWLADFNSTYGENIFFLPTLRGYLDDADGSGSGTATRIDIFAPIANGVAEWGVRDTGVAPATTGNAGSKWVNFSQNVHSYTNSGGQRLISMAPVSPQDYRPKETNRYWEANNSLNFRQTWLNAIRTGGPAADAADWVQLVTWNDYSEHSEIAPSSGIQYAFYDLAAYYTTWFKMGAQPAIERDTIFYFHRKQHGAAPRDSSKQPTAAHTDAATPLASNVELLAFAKDVPGNNTITLEIDLNDGSASTTANFTAPGIFSLTKAIPSGATARCTPSFVMKRGGVVVQAVTSNFEINNQIIYSDMLVRGGSSRRAPVESSYYARINFGSSLPGACEGGATPIYLPDVGHAYGSNSGVPDFPSTFQYGWTDTSGNPASNTANVRDRNDTLSPDERYDTLVKTLNGVTRNWQISLPAGHYKVRLVAGDAHATTGAKFKLAINGVTVIDQTASSTIKWFDVSRPILVPSGTTLLTLTTPSGANTTYNAANFIEISSW